MFLSLPGKLSHESIDDEFIFTSLLISSYYCSVNVFKNSKVYRTKEDEWKKSPLRHEIDNMNVVIRHSDVTLICSVAV